MTVEDLIQILQMFPQDKEVMVCASIGTKDYVVPVNQVKTEDVICLRGRVD